jgi:predicted nucleic acid-binding Zn ribbon protein
MLKSGVTNRMERAGRLISKLNRNRQLMTDEELACAAWALAVGKKIAMCTRAKALVRGRLVVEVQDMVWQRQLNTLTGQILKNLAEILGAGIVGDIALRPMSAPKKEAQRAMSARVGASADEADGIADPVLRRNYRISRNKATA